MSLAPHPPFLPRPGLLLIDPRRDAPFGNLPERFDVKPRAAAAAAYLTDDADANVDGARELRHCANGSAIDGKPQTYPSSSDDDNEHLQFVWSRTRALATLASCPTAQG
jgi:hypothetical protein